MLKENLQKKLNEYHKGTYVRVEYQTNTNGCLRVTKGIFRILSGIITCKNGSEIIRLKLSMNKHHKPMVTYFDTNGCQVTEKEYYSMVERKEIKDWFSKHVEDIIAIG